MAKEKAPIRKMADLLLQGAQMTDLTCPECDTILFRLKNGDLFCLSCNKKVVVLKNGESPPQETPSKATAASKPVSEEALKGLRDIVLHKIEKLSEKLDASEDPEELTKLLKVVNELLGTLRAIGQIE